MSKEYSLELSSLSSSAEINSARDEFELPASVSFSFSSGVGDHVFPVEAEDRSRRAGGVSGQVKIISPGALIEAMTFDVVTSLMGESGSTVAIMNEIGEIILSN